MSKKNKPDARGFVFSTDPGFQFESASLENAETLQPAVQPLRIQLSTKHRAGKLVTLVMGFVGSFEALEILAKQLKNHCGTGGAVKDGEVLIQGDHRAKVLAMLHKLGYHKSKII